MTTTLSAELHSPPEALLGRLRSWAIPRLLSLALQGVPNGWERVPLSNPLGFKHHPLEGAGRWWFQRFFYFHPDPWGRFPF